MRRRRHGQRHHHRAPRLNTVTTLRRLTALLVVFTGLLGACGNNGGRTAPAGKTTAPGDASGPDTSGPDTSGTQAPDTSDTDAALPEQCTPTPYTVVAQRDGGRPAGSTTFQVVGAAALPVPLVPDKAQALTPAQVNEQGATTPLLGYVVFFGDEPFGPDDVSMFGGYEPEAAGKSRGNIGLFPHSTTPLAVGDVVTSGSIEELGMLTTFNRVTMDFKAAPDELSAYLGAIRGSVTILALNNAFICVDVDLHWEYSDLSSSAEGVLTMQGVFTAPLAARSVPFT